MTNEPFDSNGKIIEVGNYAKDSRLTEGLYQVYDANYDNFMEWDTRRVLAKSLRDGKDYYVVASQLEVISEQDLLLELLRQGNK